MQTGVRTVRVGAYIDRSRHVSHLVGLLGEAGEPLCGVLGAHVEHAEPALQRGHLVVADSTIAVSKETNNRYGHREEHTAILFISMSFLSNSMLVTPLATFVS
jgi:hypothetical protein